MLEHLTKKDKAFDYIDTHAGAGLFSLNSTHARKLQEHSKGIDKLYATDWPELARYFEAIKACNSGEKLDFYPGSPMIARQFLRHQDRAWLYELHPEDFDFLQNNIGRDRRLKARHEDGMKGLLGLLPPASRRGMVLIDPSYEIKSDYQHVSDTVAKAYKKAATLGYAIWYPVVERERIKQLQRNFVKSGIKDIQCYELGLDADSNDMGMTASGMIVINPPWTLKEKMQKLLPKLVETLGEGKDAFFKCDVLVAE